MNEIEWMNENEWMNVIHSIMQPFNHSKLFGSGFARLFSKNILRKMVRIFF